ncbi:uncharacterized protein LOC131231914 isoform X2 [Magnolia sinica]|uniref:uncharacterized protein LOC131231914 isoform X2 n=1 Tax=Magnolia sinica TaxID=86752 RepID=UPI0026583BC3|nr:uncharacterized protein LOC131231914 isoform X2 [Magnolia sinica]
MAQKGNQQKNGLDCNTTNSKHTPSESMGPSLQEKKDKVKAYEGNVIDGCWPSSSSDVRMNNTKHLGDEKKSTPKSDTIGSKEELADDDKALHLEQPMPMSRNSRDGVGNESMSDDSKLRDEVTPVGSSHGPKDMESGSDHLQHGLAAEDVMAGRSLGASALSIWEVVSGWLERQKQSINISMPILFNLCNYVRLRAEYLIFWRCLVPFGKLVLLLSLLWLGCCLRGFRSLLHQGTACFFTVIWCSILSIIGMVGVSKFLMLMVIAGIVAVFSGYALAVLVTGIFATVFLWMYGSFGITGSIVFVGVIALSLGLERPAIAIATLYSIHCTTSYVGWLGLLLGLNLSFISSDGLMHFLKNNPNEHRRNRSQRRSAESRGRQPSGDAFWSASRRSTTGGAEAELTSEAEVVRLLKCKDHYAALGLSRYEQIDVSWLKREYRKKAMLVHPDKNKGNEKAVEAFKKLQNAYEVLLDSLKRKAYDMELRRDELLNYFRRFQSSSQNQRHGFFASWFCRSEADGNDSHGDSRRIACKKCGDFHTWAYTDRSKFQARWCQDCKDFHQAKDGDGWVEQSFHPFLFGLFQKVGAPCAYVCIGGKIYNVTKWLTCQGIRCAANTHKPSFHVSASNASKHGTTGTGSTSKGSGMPAFYMDESLTDEAFFEWLQNTVQLSVFEAGSPSSESPSTSSGSKSGGSNGGKRKKKGKKQW